MTSKTRIALAATAGAALVAAGLVASFVRATQPTRAAEGK